MERGVQRAVFDLQNIVGAVLDDVSDGVAVGRTQGQRLQNQHVERALNQVALKRRSATLWHTNHSTPEDHLLKRKSIKLTLRSQFSSVSDGSSEGDLWDSR
jgi:hypothetical protein